MRGKLLFITGGVVGYVLGTRAGRKRYDQIKTAANTLWQAEPVQRRVTEVRDFALERLGDVPGKLIDAGRKLGSGRKVNSNNKPPAAKSAPRTTSDWADDSPSI